MKMTYGEYTIEYSADNQGNIGSDVVFSSPGYTIAVPAEVVNKWLSLMGSSTSPG